MPAVAQGRTRNGSVHLIRKGSARQGVRNLLRNQLRTTLLGGATFNKLCGRLHSACLASRGMEQEKQGRLSDCSAQRTNGGMSNRGNNSLPAVPTMLQSGLVEDYDRDDEIERPRLEDSRASLVLQLPPELALLLPSHRLQGPQDPLLSSTMVQDAAAIQDWPNASSIRLGNSGHSEQSGHWGNNSASAMEDSLSDRLNNAGIGLEDASAEEAGSLSAATDAAATAAPGPEPEPAPVAADATSEALASVSGFDMDSSADTSSSVTSDHEVSSPRLRVLASDGEQHRQEDENHHHQQPQQPQLALGLLQVCRLTLDVLSEGGLLRDGARSWLTPELLCDKLCDRIYCPPAQPPGVGAGAPSADSSIAAPIEFESPEGRVRHWLLAEGNAAAEGGRCDDVARRLHMMNSV